MATSQNSHAHYATCLNETGSNVNSVIWVIVYAVSVDDGKALAAFRCRTAARL